MEFNFYNYKHFVLAVMFLEKALMSSHVAKIFLKKTF